MTRLLKRKKTVALIWVLVYIVLLFIPIFGNGYILMSVNSAIKKETESKNIYFMKTLGGNIDSVFKEMEASKKIIQDISGVNEMASVTKVTPQVLYELKSIGNELKRLGIYDYGKFEKFIYFPSIKKVVTSANYFDADDTAVSSKLNIDDLNYKAMLQYSINSVVTDSIENEDGSESFVYRFITVINPDSNQRYVIGILVTQQNLFGGEIDFSKSDIAVLKRQGDIYISTDKSLKSSVLGAVDQMEPCSIQQIMIDGENAEISYVKSEVLNYKYVYISRGEYIYSTVHNMRAIGILISILSMLLMALVLYKLSNWNYLNIKEVMKVLCGNDSTIEEYDENEFEFIKRSVEENAKQRRDMKIKVDLYMDSLREKFLVELLRGSVNDEKYISEEMKKYGLNFSGEYFCVTVICVKNNEIMYGKSLKDAYYIIKNIMTDMFQKETFVCAEYTDKLLCIFNFNENINVNEYMCRQLRECAEVTRMVTEITFTSVTSELAVGLQSLPYLYENVIYSLNLSEFYGMDDHVSPEDFKSIGNIFDIERIEAIENEIMICIKDGEKERMDELIDDLLTEQIEIGHTWVVMGRAYSILSKIQKMIAGLAINYSKESMEKLNSFKKFENIKSIKSFVSEYGVYAMNILESGGEEKTELYSATIEYINNHYTDPNLNVNKVSVSMGVTSIYLAYVVKQNSGVKLSEYIGKLRIEHAKKLLQQSPELKVEDVAKQSGFWQNRSFYNTFKKLTGLTPTQYRTQYKMSKDKKENE